MRLFEVEFPIRSDVTAVHPMQGGAGKVTVRIEIANDETRNAEIERMASVYAIDKVRDSVAAGGGISHGRVIELIGGEPNQRPAGATPVPGPPGAWVWSVE